MISGAEYLRGAQLYELISVAERLRNRNGEFLGLLTPEID